MSNWKAGPKQGSGNPANSRRRPCVGVLLAHHLRRWPNNTPTQDQRLGLKSQAGQPG